MSWNRDARDHSEIIALTAQKKKIFGHGNNLFLKTKELYVAQVLLVNVRLTFGGPSPIFTGAKTANLGNNFDKIFNLQLTIPRQKGIWEIKNSRVDYFDTKFGRVG